MADAHHLMRLSGHGETFRLTPQAHRLLVDYLSSSRERLALTRDVDETMRDIEAGLGDRLVALRRTSPQNMIDDRQMAEVIQEVGVVEPGPEVHSRAEKARRGRPWCRIDEGKWFGGICVGLAARGRFRLDWVRTIGIFVMLVTGGLIGLVYLAVLLVIPREATVADYEERARVAAE